jgi:hypothetical protein
VHKCCYKIRTSEVSVREVISHNVICWAKNNKLKHTGKREAISDIASTEMIASGLMNDVVWA